ncbi:MAG: hypothetical protein FWG21_01625 [Oscillospiraceae bacterium]|nr:hypothetical protein [Oscillospiraceae bacterium]
MVCKRCGSNNIAIQSVPINKKRGCLSTFLHILLLFVPIIGWIVLFSLIRGRRSKVVSMAVCQNCGRQWAV